MRLVERRNQALHRISSEPNQTSKRRVEREKEREKREDPQLKFPNGLARILRFFLSLLVDLFSAHECSYALPRSCCNIGCNVSESKRSVIVGWKKNRTEDRCTVSRIPTRDETRINAKPRINSLCVLSLLE